MHEWGQCGLKGDNQRKYVGLALRGIVTAHCSPQLRDFFCAIDNYYVIHRTATGTVSVNSKIEKALDITCYRLKYLCTRTHARTHAQMYKAVLLVGSECSLKMSHQCPVRGLQ